MEAAPPSSRPRLRAVQRQHRAFLIAVQHQRVFERGFFAAVRMRSPAVREGMAAVISGNRPEAIEGRAQLARSNSLKE